MDAKKRVLSGMRPTGRLHIGHYFGALQNWVNLQSDTNFECFFFIADWHALTSDYADTSQVAQNTIEIATDWLASGLDPEKCTMFIQSSVPEHAELSLLLSMVTPLGWLERVPTYKEALDNVKDKDLHTFGFLGYPVLQSADIVIYGEPSGNLLVPVGEDQSSHVELTREIVRRFNLAYSEVDWERTSSEQRAAIAKYFWTDSARQRMTDPRELQSRDRDIDYSPAELDRAMRGSPLDLRHSVFANAAVPLQRVLAEPDVLLTATPRIPGLDGRKMSKSYGNAITLSESDADIRAKTKVMKTDPARQRRTDPGNPDVCPVYDWHKLFSTPETLKWAAEGCRTAGIGCIECKTKMADGLIEWIKPIRENRERYAKDPTEVLRMIDEGSLKAREVAQKTMSRVREAVFNWKEKREEVTQQKSTAQNAKVGD